MYTEHLTSAITSALTLCANFPRYLDSRTRRSLSLLMFHLELQFVRVGSPTSRFSSRGPCPGGISRVRLARPLTACHLDAVLQLRVNKKVLVRPMQSLVFGRVACTTSLTPRSNIMLKTNPVFWNQSRRRKPLRARLNNETVDWAERKTERGLVWRLTLSDGGAKQNC